METCRPLKVKVTPLYRAFYLDSFQFVKVTLAQKPVEIPKLSINVFALNHGMRFVGKLPAAHADMFMLLSSLVAGVQVFIHSVIHCLQHLHKVSWFCHRRLALRHRLRQLLNMCASVFLERCGSWTLLRFRMLCSSTHPGEDKASSWYGLACLLYCMPSNLSFSFVF